MHCGLQLQVTNFAATDRDTQHVDTTAREMQLWQSIERGIDANFDSQESMLLRKASI